MDNKITGREVRQRTGIEWYTLLRYSQRRYLPDARSVPVGKGSKWVYSERDVEFINRVKFFEAAGYTLQMALSKAGEEVSNELSEAKQGSYEDVEAV